MSKSAQNIHPIHELLKHRWSPRSFSPRPVEPEKLLSLFEAARWSPSGGNSQPWSFIVVTPQDGEIFERFLGLLSGRNPLWAKNVPVLVLTVARTQRPDGQPNRFALYDLGQAVAHLSIEAVSLGLSVHQMGGYNADGARALFDLPAGYEPGTVVAIGYQGDLDVLPDLNGLRQNEADARTRKPMDEFVFEGHWNEPLREKIGVEAA